MEIEQPYYDKNGKEIKEFAVLKVFHFTGARRKRHYMYKWVKLIEARGKLCWGAYHLSEDSPNAYYHLQFVANAQRQLTDTEIVQQYD
jgi:hypothetical protein